MAFKIDIKYTEDRQRLIFFVLLYVALLRNHPPFFGQKLRKNIFFREIDSRLFLIDQKKRINQSR